MKLKPFDTVASEEMHAVCLATANWPLSGYLAGDRRGGRHVVELEDQWAATFKVKHAIACNSATSGLLAAAFAIGLKPGDRFAVPAMTMSATAAAPMFTGAKPFFCDVDSTTFGLLDEPPFDAPMFITNLFGMPAHLQRNRQWCDEHHVVMIEDNSQSPFAWEYGKFTGTVGHIGVFSLNIHKPIQCGEGGVIVTDDDHLADRMRAFINHGEHLGNEIGLNLRMPEVCAAIARVQLQRGEEIIQSRIDQATAILAAIPEIDGLQKPVVRPQCRHVYYTIPFVLADRIGTANSDINTIWMDTQRTRFCAALREEGVPIVEGYVPPLYRMPAFQRFARPCPVAEDLHDRRLFYFENCAYDVTLDQAEQIGEAFRKAARVL